MVDMENGFKKMVIGYFENEIEHHKEQKQTCVMILDVLKSNTEMPALTDGNLAMMLENCIPDVQDALEEGAEVKLRTRVCVGTCEDGRKQYIQVSGNTQDERNDNIVRAYFVSGRWKEFADYIPNADSFEFDVPRAVEVKAKHPFDAYARDWYETYQKPHLRKTSQSREGSAINNLTHYFGAKPIEDIQVRDIQDWMNQRAEIDEVSATTITDQKKVLSKILDYAMEDGMIQKNPAKSTFLKNPGHKTKGTKPFERDEFQRIINCIPSLTDSTERNLLALFCLTGMRRSEILGLKWSDINFEKHEISVERALTFANGVGKINPPKSEAGYRIISMSDMLEEILLSSKCTTEFVIAKKNGGHYTSAKSYMKLFNDLMEKIECNGATAKRFRTTFATMCSESGLEPKTIQAILGHADIDITMNTYVKKDQSRIKEVRNVLPQFMGVKQAGFASV